MNNANRRISSRAFWGLASWLLPLAVVFVVTPRLLHLLGAERFGILMIVLVTPVIASQFDLGLGSSAVRRLASERLIGRISISDTLLPYAVALSAIGLVFAGLVSFGSEWIADALNFSAALGRDEARDLVRWCAVWGATSVISAIPALVARAVQSFAWITAVQTVATVLLWIGAWALVDNDHPLREIVILGMLVSVLTAALMAFAVRDVVQWGNTPTFRMSISLEDRRFARGMFISQIASAIVFQADRILVSFLGSPAMAGAYALCINVANKPLAAVVAVTSFVFPHASGLHASEARAELSALLHSLDRAVVVLIFPLIVPAMWLAQSFMRLWLGSYGTPALVLAFQLLLIAFAVAALAVPAGHLLAASGRASLAAKFSCLTASVVVIAMLALVPPFGLLGAALAILAGMSTSLAFAAFARRALGLQGPSGRGRFWAGALLGVTTQAVVLFMLAQLVFDWWTLLFVGVASWTAFFLVRVIFKMLSSEEIRISNELKVVFVPFRKH